MTRDPDYVTSSIATQDPGGGQTLRIDWTRLSVSDAERPFVYEIDGFSMAYTDPAARFLLTFLFR